MTWWKEVTASEVYAAFRIFFGSYLAIHFAMLIPFAGEVFGAGGMVKDAALSPTFGLFPNLLSVFDSTWQVQVFLSILTVGSVSFAVGWFRRFWALLLWYGWACLFNRNVLIANPGLPYVGWLLLASSLVPAGEAWSVVRRRVDWHMPRLLLAGAWLLMGLGYTISGIHKMGASAWMDGTAILHLLDNPLARGYWWTDLLRQMPMVVMKAMTWFVLALEVLFLFLLVKRRMRLLVWVAMVGMHVGIMTTVSFVDLTLGMIALHVFTFDPRWLRDDIPQIASRLAKVLRPKADTEVGLLATTEE